MYEGPGWDTPEEAVLYYLEGLKEQDIGKMIGAYAIETYIDHFDLTTLLIRINAYTPALVPRLPNTGDLLRAMNVEARKNEIMQGLFFHMVSICMPEQDFLNTTAFMSDNKEEEAKVFVEGLEHAFGAVDFSTLKVLRFYPPEEIEDRYASEQNQENIKRQIAPTGADEARSVVVFFTVDDIVCVLGCDVMRYGDRWYMFRAQGNISNLLGFTANTGGLAAVPVQELIALKDELGTNAPVGLDQYIRDILELLEE